MVLVVSVQRESEVTMNNWWKKMWSKFRLGIYDILIGLTRKLRVIQIDEAITLANSPDGYNYMGNLIFKMARVSDGQVYTLYQCPNKKFHSTYVNVEDFIHGIAILPVATKTWPVDRFTENGPDPMWQVIYEKERGFWEPDSSLTPEEMREIDEYVERERKTGRF